MSALCLQPSWLLLLRGAGVGAALTEPTSARSHVAVFWAKPRAVTSMEKGPATLFTDG